MRSFKYFPSCVAAHVNRATVDCLRVFYEISGPSSEIINLYPVILFLSWDFAQSALQKPVRLRVLFVRLNINCWFIVPFIYLKTCFAIFICFSYGSLINCDNFITIKHKSGLVVVIAYIKLPTISLYSFPSVNLHGPLHILLILLLGVYLDLQSFIPNFSSYLWRYCFWYIYIILSS